MSHVRETGHMATATQRMAAAWTPAAIARGAVAAIDLDAFRGNVARCQEIADGSSVMVVVKADAYGHGLVQCGRAAREAGAAWLGTALLEEAIRLREAGVDGRILAWLATPGAEFARCLQNDVDLSVSTLWALEEIIDAVRSTGIQARIHLKVDTGLSRSGATASDWPSLVQAAREAERAGTVRVVGVWSHFAAADEPGHPSVARQQLSFDHALRHALDAGIDPEVRHLANSAAMVELPESHHNLVRVGIAAYGLSPNSTPAAELGLRPVMSLRARLASTKIVPAGTGASYGWDYVAERDTAVGLAPLGYADGLPRAAVNMGPVSVAGTVTKLAGRVCMDQVVIELGDVSAKSGDEVVMFGADGPSVDEWARVCDTINYEIVTRIGPRVPRVYLGESS
jgi:alanine racemase